MNKAKIAVFGASGYSGEELVKRLAEHPLVELGCLTSRQYAGKKASEVFAWVGNHSPLANLEFIEPDATSLHSLNIDFAFLALPHGVAFEFAAPLLERGIKVIDLSADFRVKDAEVYKYFYKHEHMAPELLKKSVYGLPEAYRDKIRGAKLLACPGCFPTSILIPLLPVVRANLIRSSSIIVNSLSGVSGAGRKADADLLFVECNESARPYGLPSHRHLSEIEQETRKRGRRKSDHTIRAAFDPAQSRNYYNHSCGSCERADHRLSARSVRDGLWLRSVHPIVGFKSVS